MKYKFEIIKDCKVAESGDMIVTHPNQVIKHINKYLNNETNIVAVMNESGDRWLYIIKKHGETNYIDQQPAKEKLSKYDVDLVFGGARRIYERY